MEATKNIVLIDDHNILLDGLKQLIEKLGPYKIIAQFDSGEKFIASCPLKLEPDLIILDISMPGISGIEVVEKLNAMGIKIPVLVLTIGESEEKMFKLFGLGVRGYLLKNCKADELKAALKQIFQTGYYLNELLKQPIRTVPSTSKKSEQETILEQISDKEREFLKFVCHKQEYTYEQIADMMHVQYRTVDWYRESIFDKFGIRSKTGLVLFILRNKLFDYL